MLLEINLTDSYREIMHSSPFNHLPNTQVAFLYHVSSNVHAYPIVITQVDSSLSLAMTQLNQGR